MIPVIAIVGRPNVGKSTLFNCLTHSRSALVADVPGLTRDRQYGDVDFDGQRFIVVDTGGMYGDDEDFNQVMMAQAKQAIDEANAILFVVDARSGITGIDERIARDLRKFSKPIFLIVNKIEGLDANVMSADFYSLGLGKAVPISAAHNRGINDLLTHIFKELPLAEEEPEEEHKGIKIAVIGRPNVGKSTLVNRILGEERVIVSNVAGTTRDSIYIPFTRRDEPYVLIDTAGVRRKGRISDVIEKFSIIKTLQAIEDANVVIFVIDAQEGIVEQDLHLIGFVLEAGKSLVFAINKWDDLPLDQKQRVQTELSRRLVFVDYVQQIFISALHGTNVGNLFGLINAAYESATRDISTHKVTETLERAVESHQPPAVQGRRIKLRYAHLGDHNPPLIVIHGNQTELLPESYRRYLMNYFRDAFKLVGTPIRLQFKTADNPFKGKKNILTERQKKKRERLMRHKKGR